MAEESVKANDEKKAAEPTSVVSKGKEVGGKEIKKPEFSEIKDEKASGESLDIDFLLDVPLGVSVELGRAKIAVRDMLQLGPGAVLELDKMIGEPLDLLVNDKLIARGEVVCPCRGGLIHAV